MPEIDRPKPGLPDYDDDEPSPRWGRLGFVLAAGVIVGLVPALFYAVAVVFWALAVVLAVGFAAFVWVRWILR